MKELQEIRFNGNHLDLDGNLVKGGILPEKMVELSRTISIKSDTIVDGPLYANKLTIENGDVELLGAVFSQNELYINSSAAGKIVFKKSVASTTGIVSRSLGLDLMFCADINSKSISLTNAFVAGSIYADEIVLDNCVVIGGVFASTSIRLKDCVVGTFNAPSVSADGLIQLLLPTAFSQEMIITTPNTIFYNLSLADLGGLFKGNAQAPESGKIVMDLTSDSMKSTLSDESNQKSLHTYSVVGKVLAADMLDADKFQNHFLLTAAALGPQLLRVYDLGPGQNGTTVELTQENIRDFFFKVLRGQVEIQTISGYFSMGELIR